MNADQRGSTRIRIERSKLDLNRAMGWGRVGSLCSAGSGVWGWGSELFSELVWRQLLQLRCAVGSGCQRSGGQVASGCRERLGNRRPDGFPRPPTSHNRGAERVARPAFEPAPARAVRLALFGWVAMDVPGDFFSTVLVHASRWCRNAPNARGARQGLAAEKTRRLAGSRPRRPCARDWQSARGPGLGPQGDETGQ